MHLKVELDCRPASQAHTLPVYEATLFSVLQIEVWHCSVETTMNHPGRDITFMAAYVCSNSNIPLCTNGTFTICYSSMSRTLVSLHSVTGAGIFPLITAWMVFLIFST